MGKFINLSIIFIMYNYQSCLSYSKFGLNWHKSHFENSFKRSGESTYMLRDINGPDTYAFGYEIRNIVNNNLQFREEEKFGNGTIQGSHGYIRPDGYVSITHYIADNSGYHSIADSFIDQNFRPKNRKDEGIDFTTQNSITFRIENGLNERTDSILQSTKDTILNHHNIDLDVPSESSVQENSLHPKLVNVINGEVPLVSKNTDIKGERKIGFFIPNSFPISTFNVNPKNTK